MDEINLNAREITFNQNDFIAQIKELSLKEKCGLQLTAATNIHFQNNTLRLKNLLLTTPFSNLHENIEISFAKNKSITPENISFNTKIKNSLIHPKDIEHFVTIPTWACM